MSASRDVSGSCESRCTIWQIPTSLFFTLASTLLKSCNVFDTVQKKVKGKVRLGQAPFASREWPRLIVCGVVLLVGFIGAAVGCGGAAGATNSAASATRWERRAQEKRELAEDITWLNHEASSRVVFNFNPGWRLFGWFGSQ